MGLGAAWLLLQASRFTLAIDLRVWITAFGSAPPIFARDQTAKDLGVLPWFSLGFSSAFVPEDGASGNFPTRLGYAIEA